MKRSTKIKYRLKKALLLVLNPRFLLCFGLAWIITNGWSYILFAVGMLCRIPWMATVAGAYMTFLWFPFTPEKLLTVIIAMALLRWLFPNDEKTLGILKEMYAKLKMEGKKVKEKRQKRKQKTTLDEVDTTQSQNNES